MATDVFNIQVDASTVALVDAYANRSAFRPSRRQAVRALLRQALQAHKIKLSSAQPAPTMTAPTPAGEQRGAVR